jgi:hypothetical protein
MGFNYAGAGFGGPQAMFQALAGSVAEQIGAFFRFVESRQAAEAMRAEDYPAVARSYNGGGQVEAYAAKLHGYVATLRALRQPAAAPGEPAAQQTPTPPPQLFPAPPPAEEAEAEADYWRWWLSMGAAALALLAAIAIALHQAGWRLVKAPDPDA